VAVLDHAHEITDCVDLVGDNVRHSEPRYLIFYGDYYFEAIKPIGSEIALKTCVVRHARRIDTEMSGYDLANLDVDHALHGRSSKSNQRALGTFARAPLLRERADPIQLHRSSIHPFDW
jgi:hypothetical protein